VAKNKKTKAKSPKRSPKPGWWASLDSRRRAQFVRRSLLMILVAAASMAGATAMDRLDTHVDQLLLSGRPDPELTLLDLPAEIVALAETGLRDRLSDLLTHDWTDDRLCRAMALRLKESAWIEQVYYVRRTSTAEFQVSCAYRVPYAMVQQGNDFHLVDRNGVALPGLFQFDPAWKLIQGVGSPAPQAGETWPGEDLLAALHMILLLQDEPFSGQVTAILVENFDGRMNPRGTHVELATDRAGGRIRWGSAPGRELVENRVEEKLAILRENYRRTGRADAHHPVIDVATFPDRFTIPG